MSSDAFLSNEPYSFQAHDWRGAGYIFKTVLVSDCGSLHLVYFCLLVKCWNILFYTFNSMQLFYVFVIKVLFVFCVCIQILILENIFTIITILFFFNFFDYGTLFILKIIYFLINENFNLSLYNKARNRKKKSCNFNWKIKDLLN